EQERAHPQVAETRNVAQTLVRIVDESADEWPDLYAWPPERVAQEGIALRDAYQRKTGRMPTYDTVLSRLQAQAKAEAQASLRRQSAIQQKRGGRASDAGSAGKAATKGESGAQEVPALSGRTANIKATPPREKTEAELDEECLADLRATFGRKSG